MKSDINPMQAAVRCKAHSKRTGQLCGSPAVRGWSVCRMHGAGGGAPCGRRNGNYRHGYRTKEAVRARRELAALLRESRQTLALLA
jgi:hypothetical protein